MQRQFLRLSLTVIFLALFSSFVMPGGSSASPLDDRESSKQAALHDAMRKLWEDHVTWTRVFIISAAGDLPDKTAATNRLLQNQVDIGNAIKPYYGDAAGNQLTALLKDHILIAADVLAAAKANDQAKLNDANSRWSANADQLAAFLGKANPKNWPEAEMRQMLHDQTRAEIAARRNL